MSTLIIKGKASIGSATPWQHLWSVMDMDNLFFHYAINREQAVQDLTRELNIASCHLRVAEQVILLQNEQLALQKHLTKKVTHELVERVLSGEPIAVYATNSETTFQAVVKLCSGRG